VRFQVLMAATMKIAVIRGVTPGSLVVVTNVSNPVASETSEEIYHTTFWQHILEDSNLHGGSFFYLFRLPKQRKTKRTSLFWVIMLRAVVISYQRFRTTLSVPSSKVENPKSHGGKPKLVMRERFQFYKQCHKRNVSGK